MGFENKFARFMRNTGPARFFIPMGLILIIAGILLMVFSTGDFVETTAKNQSVEEVLVTGETNQTEYEIKFDYEVGGKIYTGSFQMVKEYKVGDEITIYYESSNPEKITNTKNGNLIGWIMIGVGAVAIVGGIFATVKAFQKSKALDEAIPGGKPDTTAFNNFKTDEGVTEYYFRFDGHSLKPGYIIEDANRNVLFEGKMTKQALVGARTYEFHNHVTGSVAEHQIGHTITQSYNDEFFSRKSWFKVDGENVWDLLHGKGIRLITDLHSELPYLVYNVSRNGNPIAIVETSSLYVHEDEEAQHKIVLPTGNMYYRFWTNSSDFETLFLTIFAISETEQTVVE
ncbi:MAG: DUF3592 domain-containing protein [Ruminococcaceae bacterium]|nr:DUF3592 domain-containing protein [Oscillospiraceae bacterium]